MLTDDRNKARSARCEDRKKLVSDILKPQSLVINVTDSAATSNDPIIVSDGQFEGFLSENCLLKT